MNQYLPIRDMFDKNPIIEVNTYTCYSALHVQSTGGKKEQGKNFFYHLETKIKRILTDNSKKKNIDFCWIRKQKALPKIRNYNYPNTNKHLPQKATPCLQIL